MHFDELLMKFVLRQMYGGKDALSDPPSGVAHEGAHWVWKLNGYRVQVCSDG